MSDGFALAEGLADSLLRDSRSLWAQQLPDTGKKCEASGAAWARLFGEPMPPPIYFGHATTADGCLVVVRLYPRGRIMCVQGGFASIRTVVRSDRAGNIADRLAALDPASARENRTGQKHRGPEPESASDWFDWAAALPRENAWTSTLDIGRSHHARVGGAAQRLLIERNEL